ncbi:MAG: hypothetical protein R3F12_12040 [Lysobacteraceae bacterium]
MPGWCWKPIPRTRWRQCFCREVAHVTQQHILRSVEKAKKDALPIALGMLGAIVAAQSAGDNGDARRRRWCQDWH